MLKEQKAVVELIGSLVLGRTADISRVEYFPQKPAFPQGEMQQKFPRATPESQGISSAWLAGMIEELSESKAGDIHQFLAVKGGHVICECSFSPYRRGIWHITHSLCKSITGMAVGMLISEEKLSLDDRLVDIFKSRQNLFSIFRQRDITIRHLLTMTSGVSFNETGAVAGSDWVKGFLEAGIHDSPGTKFEYNSMNTYMLSAAVTEITGETMMEYLRPRLWEPLGITKVFWETCPKGVTKGGWGLFLTPEDAAKLGWLYRCKGIWNGQQIVAPEWIEESVKKQIDTVGDGNACGYGYQIWPKKREGSFNFNGMLGQNVLVYPDLDLVIVTNAGSSEIFQEGTVMETLERYIDRLSPGMGPISENAEAARRLGAVIRNVEAASGTVSLIGQGGWRSRKPSAKCRSKNWRLDAGSGASDMGIRNGLAGIRELMRLAEGRVYIMDNDSVGFFPLMMQVFHNNYTEGIKKLWFTSENGRLWMEFTEGEEDKKVEIGMGAPCISEVTEHEEPYLAAITGTTARDEDGRLVLKLDISFIEEAARRTCRIYFEDKKIELRFNETPGKAVILNGIAGIMQDAGSRLKWADKKDGKGARLIQRVMESSIAPIIYGNEETAEAEQEESVEN